MSQSLPDNDPLVDDQKKPFRTWFQWLSWVHRVVTSVTQSGTTAERPTQILWVGRPYFDTTLGKPIWFESANPNVWVDATGTPV